MAWEARLGLKPRHCGASTQAMSRLNGLGSPFGFETETSMKTPNRKKKAKWPGKPVWV